MSILEEISKLTKPVFDLPDLEDEDVDGTASKALKSTLVESDDGPPRRVRKAIDLSIDDGCKYGGTKVSRNDIFDEFSEMAGLGDRSKADSDEVNSSGEEDEDGLPMFNGDKLGGYSEEDGDDDEEEKDDEGVEETEDGSEGHEIHNEEEDDDDEDEGDNGEDDLEEEHAGIGSDSESEVDNEGDVADKQSSAVTMKDLMKTVDQDRHNKKAEAVSAQTQTWEQLLYVKIKLQAALRAFNQLPRGQLAKDLLKEADEETKANMKAAHENAAKLVSNLLEAERLLLAASSFTSSMVGKKGAADSDDEEIESSDDEAAVADGSDIEGEEEYEDDGDDEEEEEEQEQTQQATSISMKSLSKRICESEEQFAKFRDATLIKWEGRTRLIASRRPKNASTDFSAFEKENIVSQIEKVCSDKQRLVKRSRVKKSDIERIGGNPEAEEDEEIYDDDDFYQVLLKELISKKSSNTEDPVAMTRHYIEMQKLKSKRARKKEIDNRASKDRKIKYLPIPKLVNFHPAMPEMVEWNHETRNELFKSLFS